MDGGQVPGVALDVRGETLAIARLGASDPWPEWALRESFVLLARTETELSIVCPDRCVPEGVRADRGWRALQVRGVLDLALTGVLAGLASVLAAASVPLFAVSTFDTDYLLVPQGRVEEAINALTDAGYSVFDSK